METVWSTTATAIRSVIEALDDDVDINGVGVTGQGDGCWLIDEAGEPVRNAILWSDSRTAGVLETWEADGTLKDLPCACDRQPRRPVVGTQTCEFVAYQKVVRTLIPRSPQPSGHLGQTKMPVDDVRATGIVKCQCDMY
jgi:hypothetical protein